MFDSRLRRRQTKCTNSQKVFYCSATGYSKGIDLPLQTSLFDRVVKYKYSMKVCNKQPLSTAKTDLLFQKILLFFCIAYFIFPEVFRFVSVCIFSDIFSISLNSQLSSNAHTVYSQLYHFDYIYALHFYANTYLLWTYYLLCEIEQTKIQQHFLQCFNYNSFIF